MVAVTTAVAISAAAMAGAVAVIVTACIMMTAMTSAHLLGEDAVIWAAGAVWGYFTKEPPNAQGERLLTGKGFSKLKKWLVR